MLSPAALLADATDAGSTVTIRSADGRVVTGTPHDHPTDPESILVRRFSPSTPAVIHRDDVEEVIAE
jgi:hypothetical protein